MGNKYMVTFDYAEGEYYGSRVIPKNDRFNTELWEMNITDTDNIKEEIAQELKRRGVKIPFIVNHRIVSKED